MNNASKIYRLLFQEILQLVVFRFGDFAVGQSPLQDGFGVSINMPESTITAIRNCGTGKLEPRQNTRLQTTLVRNRKNPHP